MAETLGIREYARLRGCTHQAVQKAIKTGRLVKAVSRTLEGKPRINPEIADVEWALTTDQAQQRAARQGDLFQDGRTAAMRGSAAGSTYAANRAQREEYSAKLAELDLKERLGRLVSVADVKAEAFEVARKVRERLLAIPARTAGPLSSMRDPRACEELLTGEIDLALAELSRRGDG